MRTTLDIDDDVLQAVRELGKAAGKPAGKMLSELARRTLAAQAEAGPDADDEEACCGFRPFARHGRKPVTNEDVKRIREELGI